MNSLPNSDDFQRFQLKLLDSKVFKSKNQNLIDLNAFDKNLKASRLELKENNLSGNSLSLKSLEYKLFELDFLRSINKRLSGIFDKYLGYSKKYDSLTVSVLDENNDVKAIAIRRAFDKENKPIKWKSYGAKSYVPYKIKDDFIFFAVGMAEYILFELIDVSYILLQSDSMYRYIPEEVVAKVKNKQIIILKENDESFEKLIVKLHDIFLESNIFIIDFEKVLNKKLPKSYDFIDCVNEVRCLGAVEQLIENEIMKQMKDKK